MGSPRGTGKGNLGVLDEVSSGNWWPLVSLWHPQGCLASVPRDARARSIAACAVVKSGDYFLPTEKPTDELSAAVLCLSEQRHTDGGGCVSVNI